MKTKEQFIKDLDTDTLYDDYRHLCFNTSLIKLSGSSIPQIDSCCSHIYSNLYHFYKQGRTIRESIHQYDTAGEECYYHESFASDLERLEAFQMILKVWEHCNV